MKFPGFKHGEFIELPAKLEALQILHQVSKAQSFKVSVSKMTCRVCYFIVMYTLQAENSEYPL